MVGWSDGSIAPATALASLVDCDQPKTGEQEKKPGPGGTDESGFISNISGLCDAELITLARQALSAPDPTPLLDEAEGLLAQAAIYLPIYRDAALVVVTDGCSASRSPGRSRHRSSPVPRGGRCRNDRTARGARRLLLVHAHPDDESLMTGGTIAHYPPPRRRGSSW